MDPLLEEKYVRVKPCRYGTMLYFSGDSYVGRSLDLYGEFSEGEVRLFDQVLRPGMTAIDVGANIGCHTVFMSKKLGPTGRLHAFEPQRIVYQALVANLALNAIENTQTYQCGVGQKNDIITVPRVNYEAGGNFGGLALGSFDQGDQVPLRSIDSLELSACHFIKIDVEGMETEALKGAKQTLQKFEPYLYVENDRRERSAELIDTLFSLDYRLYWHLPTLYNPENFYANPENVFGNVISRNMLGVPKSKDTQIKEMPEITSSDITF